MSRTKEYMFEINHPSVWVKGEGSGLPRVKEREVILSSGRIIKGTSIQTISITIAEIYNVSIEEVYYNRVSQEYHVFQYGLVGKLLL